MVNSQRGVGDVWMCIRVIALISGAILLASCAAKPQATMQTLSTADPKFNSPECLDIRNRALVYDDRVGERAAVGIASGLFLGVFGLPLAASVDAAQNQEREAFNREIELRCMTNPPKREAPAPSPAAPSI